MELFRWIKDSLKPRICDSVEFVYDGMESQSGRSLPILYVPFDAGKRSHWRDRGAMFDFLYTTGCEGAKLLDFGPGDGWPSLILAHHVGEVVGVDGSLKRVAVCTGNAERLGIKNARFVHVKAGERLPFADGEFDGISAASSIEQTPDPRETIEELYRVLKPGGRMRIYYESLDEYAGGGERDCWLCGVEADRSMLILFDRDIARGCAMQYAIDIALPARGVVSAFSEGRERLAFEDIDIRGLESVLPSVTDARTCTTTHPSGKTLVEWLRNAGFSEAKPTHSGADAAGELFRFTAPDERPKEVDGVDRLVAPLIRVATILEAPISRNPPITAIR